MYSEGVPENIIALAQGVGSLSGILGTVLFPWLRKKVGLRLAGLIALSMELVCLSPSVLSIWLDGSPFDPGSYFSPTASPSTATKNYSNPYLFVVSVIHPSSTIVNLKPEVGKMM